ncbi:MAG: hypothetical protein K6A89_09060 [Treponema sp.]|nr:hypothetical protein [Treponema sp.]
MEARKIIVRKIDENFEIASMRYSGSIELKDKVLIKGSLVNQFIEMLKKIDHAPDEDFEDLRNKLDFLLGELTKENAE